MGKLTSIVADLELELLTSATVVMSLLVYLQEFVRIMGSGLEMHQFVRVSSILNYYRVRQKFRGRKISPKARALYWDKNFAEFNFANSLVRALGRK